MRWILVLVALASCGDRKAKQQAARTAPVPTRAPIDATVALVDAAPIDAAPIDAPDDAPGDAASDALANDAPPIVPLTVQCGAQKKPLVRAALYPTLATTPLRHLPAPATNATRLGELVMPEIEGAKYGDRLAYVGDTIAMNRRRSVQLYDSKLANPREVKLDMIPGDIELSPDGATVAATLHPDDDQDFPAKGIAFIDAATGKESGRVGMGYIGNVGFVSNTEVVALGHPITTSGDPPDVFERYDVRTLRTLTRYRFDTIRDPKLVGTKQDGSPYVGQEDYNLGAYFLADGTAVIAANRMEYRSGLKDIGDGQQGSEGSTGWHAFLVEGTLAPGRFAQTASVAIGGLMTMVNGCAVIADSTKEEHFAWIFDGAAVERLALPAQVTAIASGGNWLVFGLIDGRVVVVDASDWSHHTQFQAREGHIDSIAVNAAGEIVIQRGATLARWSMVKP
jgi:hypothetical protein